MMAEEGKKISFGFSKSIKKPLLNLKAPEVKKVDYIECLEDKAIKVIGGEEKKDEPLVIPMLGSRTWHERILNKVDADIFEPKIIKNEEIENNENDSKAKVSNGQVSGNNCSIDITEVKKEKGEEVAPVSLEEQAAQEILRDLGQDVKVEIKDFTVPITGGENLEGQKEPTLENYEEIPIEAFGLAMLRGMGWKPGKGIGRNEQLVAPKLPELRPRGMGLGADKAVLKKNQVETKTKEEEELKLIVGAFVKINGGKYSDKYGQVEDIDFDAGRLTVKLAIGGATVSLNECLVKLVTKAEYSKKSNVLNAAKYEEYANRDLSEKNQSEVNLNTSESRKRRSDDSSDDDRRSKRRKSSSPSSDDHREKKSKKKQKNREKSSKHSKKSKKKEKNRDRSRERRSNYSESLDRRKSRKNRRRSRS